MINLTRLGHYSVPTGGVDPSTGANSGSCQTSLVVGVPNADHVNIITWTHDASVSKHMDVLVATPQEDHASFHLSLDCPWLR